MPRTTPPRPEDIAALLPALAPLARTAIRLHPRPGTPTAGDSSVGGPLLWPTREPWPHCPGPHEPDGYPATTPADQRARRRLLAAAHRRPPGPDLLTPRERAELDRIAAGHPWPREPVALLPVAQLYTRDVPVLRPPAGQDVLQVLWCPFEHEPDGMPRTRLLWRSSAGITGLPAEPPEPAAAQSDFVPEPCLLHPEAVTEYPCLAELAEIDPAAADLVRARDSDDIYDNALSVAPGWKAGGWAPWGGTDPVPPECSACGTGMTPLLTLATREWDADSAGWIPYEDRAAAAGPAVHPDPATPTMLAPGRGHDQQLYGCPAAPDHPHAGMMQ